MLFSVMYVFALALWHILTYPINSMQSFSHSRTNVMLMNTPDSAREILFKSNTCNYMRSSKVCSQKMKKSIIVSKVITCNFHKRST